MGGYTAVTSNVWFMATDACYSSIGLLFKLYRHHFGTLPLEVSGNSPQHPVKGTVGVDRPAVTSGSDTYPLDIAAALTKDRKTVTVAVVNPAGSAQTLNLRFTGARFRSNIAMYQIAVPELNVRNVPGQEPAIRVEESTVRTIADITQVAPWSISLYELPMR